MPKDEYEMIDNDLPGVGGIVSMS